MQKKRKRWDVWLVECLLWPFRLLPLGFHYACGRGLAWFLEKVMHYRRDVVFINLSRSFPDKKYHEIRAIAKDFYRHLGDLFAEAIWFGGCRGDRGRKRLSQSHLVEFVNPEVLNAAADRGKGTILMMSHSGNWELFGGIAQYYYDVPLGIRHDGVAVVYKEMTSKFWDCFLEYNRCAPELDTSFDGYVESKDVLRFAVKHRHDNFVYAFNNDQFPYKGAQRYDVGEFMHQPTLAMGGAAVLAAKMGMTVLYLRWERPERGHWKVTLVPLAEDASAVTPESVMKQYYALLQEDLEKDPSNYLWTHKRWK